MLPVNYKQLLRHPNPNLRYAGARIGGDFDRQHVDAEDCAAAFLVENSRVVRRELAAHMDVNSSERDRVDAILDKPEGAYFIESNPNRDLPSHIAKRWLVPHRLLEDDIKGVMTLCFKADEPIKPLVTAYQKGFDTVDLSFVVYVTASELRDAVKLTSPIEREGLGTHDKLKKIEEIDRLFLLFRQVQFYKSWGDLLALPLGR